MPPAVFEPTFPTSEPSQTHALDRAAIGIDSVSIYSLAFYVHYSEP